jgi:mevalonate kinase
MSKRSASAKFLLAGEYSVLLEGPALAIPLVNLQLHYHESPNSSDSGQASPSTRVYLNHERITDHERLSKVLALREIITTAPAPSEIHITTQIPIGKGLGSSAALCVAMTRFHHHESTREQVAEIALEGEKLFHGNPSGVDPYCVSFEAPIAYTRSPRQCHTLDLGSLKDSGLIFLLRDSGGEHSTKVQLQTVMTKESLIRELAVEAKQMLEAVGRDAKGIAPIMKRIQVILNEAGASSPAIEANIAELYSLGAQGAKITGSGRGGFVVSVFEPSDFAKLPSSVRSSAFSWQPS